MSREAAIKERAYKLLHRADAEIVLDASRVKALLAEWPEDTWQDAGMGAILKLVTGK